MRDVHHVMSPLVPIAAIQVTYFSRHSSDKL